MSIHKSLRVGRGTAGNRNVLTRWERIQKLKELERWEQDKVYGLAKVRVSRVKVGAKKKKAAPKAEGAEAAAAAGAEAAPAADKAAGKDAKAKK